MRVSDLGRLVHMSMSGKYAEGSLMRVKTARSKNKKTVHVPTSDPSYAGLHGFELDASFHCYQETVGSIGYSHAGVWSR